MEEKGWHGGIVITHGEVRRHWLREAARLLLTVWNIDGWDLRDISTKLAWVAVQILLGITAKPIRETNECPRYHDASEREAHRGVEREGF